MMLNVLRSSSAAFARRQVGRLSLYSSRSAARAMSTTYYTEEHEYIRVDGNVGTVGITDFAQNQLGDIVFVDLPAVDQEFEKGDEFGTIESVKAASEVYAPVGGVVIEINENLEDEAKLVNVSPDDEGWMIKIEIADASELDTLLTEDAYQEHCDNLDH